MRVSFPITITKAGAPVTPHLVSVHLGGSSNVDALGFQKSDGSIVLFQMGGAAIILDQSGKINFGVDYDENYCFFGQDSEQAYTEFADQYEWMVPSLGFKYDVIEDFAHENIYIEDPESGENLIVAYDICMDKSESHIALPLNVFIPPVNVELETAFVTTCEVEGRPFLALSINGVVRPIYDILGNGGCPVTDEGGTFNVSDCSDVGAAGSGMSSLPLQAALGNKWSPRSCSMDGVLVTTYLKCDVFMLDFELIVTTELITNPGGTWYIPTSQFTVNEA